MSEELYGKLEQPLKALIQHYCAVQLSVIDYSIWRERRVEKIRPIDYFTYCQSTSYQLNIPGSVLTTSISNLMPIVRSSFESGLFDGKQLDILDRLTTENLDGCEFELIIPLDRFPKRILSGFSLRNDSNHAVPFIGRDQAARIGSEVLAYHLRREGDKYPAIHKPIQKIVENCEVILAALVFCAPNDMARTFESAGISKEIGKEVQKCLDVRCLKIAADLYEEYFRLQFQNQGLAEISLNRSQFQMIRDLLAKASQVNNRLKERNVQGLWNVALNPLLLVGEYLHLTLQEFDEVPSQHNRDLIQQRLINQFLREAQIYLESLIEIGDKEDVSFLPLMRCFGKLDIAVYSYLGFSQTKVVLGRPFILKSEQVLSAKIDRFPKFFRVGYGLNMGAEKSWHLEVAVPSPTELFLSHTGHQITIAGIEKKYDPRDFFGAGVGSKRERIHYYKKKDLEQIEEWLSRESDYKPTPGFRPDYTLWIRYKISHTVLLSYYLVLFVVLCSSLGAIFLDEKTLREHTPWMAFAVPLIIFVLGAKEKESITVQRLAWIKLLAIVLGFVFYGCVLGLPILKLLKTYFFPG